MNFNECPPQMNACPRVSPTPRRQLPAASLQGSLLRQHRARMTFPTHYRAGRQSLKRRGTNDGASPLKLGGGNRGWIGARQEKIRHTRPVGRRLIFGQPQPANCKPTQLIRYRLLCDRRHRNNARRSEPWVGGVGLRYLRSCQRPNAFSKNNDSPPPSSTCSLACSSMMDVPPAPPCLLLGSGARAKNDITFLFPNYILIPT